MKKKRTREALKEGNEIIGKIASREIDPYLGWRHLYTIYTQSGGLKQFKSFFDIPGIEVDGMLSVSSELCEEIVRRAVGFIASRKKKEAILK